MPSGVAAVSYDAGPRNQQFNGLPSGRPILFMAGAAPGCAELGSPFFCASMRKAPTAGVRVKAGLFNSKRGAARHYISPFTPLVMAQRRNARQLLTYSATRADGQGAPIAQFGAVSILSDASANCCANRCNLTARSN